MEWNTPQHNHNWIFQAASVFMHSKMISSLGSSEKVLEYLTQLNVRNF